MTERAQSPLAIARGGVREGLAALDGFGDLLGSRRIGPRALAQARGDVALACDDLRGAFADLERAFGVALREDEDALGHARAICDHGASRAASLGAVLSSDESLSDARRRLALEAVVRKHGAELRDALALCELLAVAASPAPTDIDLVDVLEQCFARPKLDRSAEGGVVQIAVEAPRPTSIIADPRVLGGLVEIAADIASRHGMTNARLGVVRVPGGGMKIRVSSAPKGASAAKVVVQAPLRGSVPGALSIASAAARRARLGFRVDEASGVVSIEADLGHA